MLTQTQLRSFLHYDPKTGIFTRIARCSPKSPYKVGDLAGSKGSKGHLYIMVAGKVYAAHRLAWLYVYGAFPAAMIDHRNLIRDDNRIDNLREATRSQNSMNSGVNSRNTTGFKGVSFFKKTSRWKASAKINGKPTHLGYFDTPQAASDAYQGFAKKHHGAFAYQGDSQ
jgi:hypothetical protein